ncbi:hypothetical protein K1719_035551 [Acacia pycnantha]|nr:hypothetical protein K1719_035551 [Acacia pycnantha]
MGSRKDSNSGSSTTNPPPAASSSTINIQTVLSHATRQPPNGSSASSFSTSTTGQPLPTARSKKLRQRGIDPEITVGWGGINFALVDFSGGLKLHHSCRPGRTDNEIKNIWNSCLKKKLRKRGIDQERAVGWGGIKFALVVFSGGLRLHHVENGEQDKDEENVGGVSSNELNLLKSQSSRSDEATAGRGGGEWVDSVSDESVNESVGRRRRGPNPSAMVTETWR